MTELRDYSSANFEQLWALDQKCFPPGIAYSREELAFYLESPAAICLIAWSKGKILGFALGNRDRRGFGHIITLDVDPVRQRSGCGSTLIEALETRFANTGCDSILLEVAVNNRAALGFYKKHGYAVVKTLRRYYPGGLDGLLMGKRILNNDT